jgi:hypothetical protein
MPVVRKLFPAGTGELSNPGELAPQAVGFRKAPQFLRRWPVAGERRMSSGARSNGPTFRDCTGFCGLASASVRFLGLALCFVGAHSTMHRAR